MQVTFTYDREKDVWCLLNKGKSSSNSSQPTKQYEALVAAVGEQPTEVQASQFIDSYLAQNGVDIDKNIIAYQSEWNSIAAEFQKRAEAVFGVTLLYDVSAYLSINSRSPYSLQERYFYVAVPAYSLRKTAMHELWHFYTWQKFGKEWEDKLGAQKYNDIKEALTVLLNIECANLIPGIEDKGYPQHQELRMHILDFWRKDKNIETVWSDIIN